MHAEVLEVRGDRVFVTVVVEGKEVEALLDSGAEVTIFDTNTGDALGLTGGTEVEARGTGAKTVRASLVENITLNALGRNVNIPVAAVMDLSDVGSRLLNAPLPMVLGREIFDAGRIAVDIEGGRIDWVERDTQPLGKALDLSPSHGIETIPVEFGPLGQLRADFDLGNGSGLLISSKLATDLDLSPVGFEPAGGIGGSLLRAVVIVPEVTLAGRTFYDVRAHVSSDLQVPANVGVSLLRHFMIVTDFPEKRVWLIDRRRQTTTTDVSASPHGGRIETSPGPVSQWYRVAGKPSDTPIVLLHGGPGQGSQTFQASIGPELEKFTTVVYFDQRGSGRSDRPSNPDLYSIPILVSDLDELLDTIGADQAILLGHSFGSVLALEYAAKQPDRVAGLVLTGAIPDMPEALQALCKRLESEDPDAYRRSISMVDGTQKCEPFAAYDDKQRKDWIEQAMFPNPTVARQVEEWDNIDGLGNTGELGNALWSKGLMSYRFEAAERLSMPVLFIDGALDHQTAIEPQQELVSKIVAGDLLSYERSGHFPFLDEPFRFANDVQAFLDRVEASPK
ncbi:alpha/beta fold hydrolase [Altererythrobacter xiamenensis]|uniref:alpha/beta fold hydrolase n=1 Tax=Altererythrobacter xiamenensis TaxID=1316679 RepID=UPI0013563841|nr:alpha/beta fold hydrolase [Altererythrobacter xiamenensis]